MFQKNRSQLLSNHTSVSSVSQKFVNLFDIDRAVSCILVFVIWHNWILVPNSNNDGILGPCNSSTTTSSTGEVSSIGFGVMLGHHKLLVAHSYTCCCRVALALGDTHCTIEFYYLQILCGTIFQFLGMLIFVKTWPIRGWNPARPINSINGSMLADISFQILALFVWIGILNSPDVRVPPVRHLYLILNYTKSFY